MPYQKLKKEEYRNIGGINQKASVYVTGEREVVDLVNYSFQTAGAWTQRPGLTTALAGNTLAVGASNRFNFGFQAYRVRTDTFGTSFTQATYVQSNSMTYSLSLSNGVLSSVSGGTQTYTAGFGNAVGVAAQRYGSGSSTNIYENLAYFSSGKATFKANYSNIYFYGLPFYADNGTVLSGGFSGTGSLTGTYNLRAVYGDFTGYAGPDIGLDTGAVSSGQFQIYVSGATYTTKALQSGADRVYVYANRANGFGASEYVYMGSIDTGTTLTIRATLGLLIPDSSPPSGNPLIPTVMSNAFATTNGNQTVAEADCVEFYANRTFWGLSKGQNLIFYSAPVEFSGDAQSVDVDNTLQVRNSNFPLTALKSYNQSLIAFFQKGVTRITGDNPNNFNGQNLTDKYGAICQRAIVVWQERLWFLDEYQIIEFNGANFQTISNRVQGYLNRMNVTAAQKTATAYHYESRNEVWVSIPIDGSNENNLTLIYDYNADGWYVVKSTSNFTMLQQYADQTLVQGITASTVFLNNPRLFTAHPGGSMGYYDSTFRTDYGSGFTMTYKTRYHVEQGPSSTMEWRRFFQDTGPWAGVTRTFTANFYANFATSTVALTRSIYDVGSPYSGPQQQRIDFGIPAKSLSLEVSTVSGASTPPVQVYGYTVESRFLRNV